MTHKHHCSHGTWTCDCDAASGFTNRGVCGTCLRIGMTGGLEHPAVLPTECDRCGGPLEPGDVKGFLALCRTCEDVVEKQLRDGKFLG